MYSGVMQARQKKQIVIKTLTEKVITMDVFIDSKIMDVRKYVADILDIKPQSMVIISDGRMMQDYQKAFETDKLMVIIKLKALTRNEVYPIRERIYNPSARYQHSFKIKIMVQQLRRQVPFWFQQKLIENILYSQNSSSFCQHLGYVKKMVDWQYFLLFVQYLLSQQSKVNGQLVQQYRQFLQMQVQAQQIAKIMIKWNFQAEQDHQCFRALKQFGFPSGLKVAEDLNNQLNQRMILAAKQPRITQLIQTKYGLDRYFRDNFGKMIYETFI